MKTLNRTHPESCIKVYNFIKSCKIKFLIEHKDKNLIKRGEVRFTNSYDSLLSKSLNPSVWANSNEQLRNKNVVENLGLWKREQKVWIYREHIECSFSSIIYYSGVVFQSFPAWSSKKKVHGLNKMHNLPNPKIQQ